MHICFLGQYPYKNQTAGGVGTFTQTLAEALVKQGIRVSVIAMYPHVKEVEELQNGVHVYWLNQQKWPAANFIRNAFAHNQFIKKIHRAHTIDVFETQEAGLAFLQRIKGIKYVIRLHGGHYFFSRTLGQPFSRSKAFMEKRSFGRADALIAVSKYVLDETAKYIPLNQAKAVVIHNPVDTKKFAAVNESHVVKHRIFFAGRLVEKKGIRQLIEAMPLVLEKYPDASLHIYGGDTVIDHGTSFKALLEQKIPTSIAPNISFKGEVKNEDLSSKMAAADICVYPSHMEAMPIAWLEVMAMAKPFVASKAGPGTELINDDVDGLLCDPFSAEDIAAKIIWMFEHPNEAKQMGLNARKKVEEQFVLNKICSKNIAYFQQLIATR